MPALRTFLEEDKRLKIAFCRCIMTDVGPTGLVRLSQPTKTRSTDQPSPNRRCEKEKVLVATIAPRSPVVPNATFFAPDVNCTDIPLANAGSFLAAALAVTNHLHCPHPNHDFDRQFCATCNWHDDHCTGQTKYPNYPRFVPVPFAQAPVIAPNRYLQHKPALTA